MIADEFAAIEARPDEGLPDERMDEWMIENGLTTSEPAGRERRLGAAARLTGWRGHAAPP
jgi:hypothetical protein